MRPSRLFLIAVLAATAGCGDTPLALDSTTAIVPSAARVGGHVITPMSAEITVVWNVDQSADALAACAPRPGLAVGEGSGHGTLLGQFRVVRMDHCSIDLTTTPPTIDGNGDFELQAADGSTIHGTYVFLLLPLEAGGLATLTIEDGTGRFGGAEGVLDVTDGLDDLTCGDPLCFTAATLTAQLEGSIALPRSGVSGAPGR